MSSLQKYFVFGIIYLLSLKFIQGQRDYYSWLESINGTDTSNDTESSSCIWESTPGYGFSFMPCPQTPGVCKCVQGSYKKTGTVRVTQCRRHFSLAWGRDMDTCEDGQWTSSGHQCVPCGRSQLTQDSKSPLTLSAKGEFPWQGALYTKLDQGQWELICGVTMISSNLVITAAHCLTLAGADVELSNIRVGLGKLHNFDTNENSSVISTVKQIIRPDDYDGLNSQFDRDVALLVLSERVKMGPRIMPVCLDWKDAMSSPVNNETGFLADWQVAQQPNGVNNVTLHWYSLKYMDHNTCRSSGEEFITKERFCATETNELTEGEHEDNGGGLTLVRDGVHYLYGVVNTKLFGENGNVRVFTNIMSKRYKVWLLKQWRKVNTGSPPSSQERGY